MTKATKPQSVQDYGFTGVHIPPNIWLSRKVKRNEVLVLMEINALSQGRACTASNKYLADHLDLEVRRIQQIISKLVRLGLVLREVTGPFRFMFVDPVALAAFDREPTINNIERFKRKKERSTMQKIAPLPCNKLHAYHAINCTQVEKKRVKEEDSTVERREGRGVPPASSFNSDQGRGNSGLVVQKEAFNGRASTEQPQTAPDRAGTPKGAPWAGKSYANHRRDQLPGVESYEDIWGLAADPVLAAMATTGETMSGGYGFWIKWLNSAASKNGLETAVEFFMGSLAETWGEVSIDGIRNPAAVFNNKLKKLSEVAA